MKRPWLVFFSLVYGVLAVIALNFAIISAFQFFHRNARWEEYAYVAACLTTSIFFTLMFGYAIHYMNKPEAKRVWIAVFGPLIPLACAVYVFIQAVKVVAAAAAFD